MSSSPLIPEISLTPTMGAVFIGVVCAAILEGITTMQTIFYFTTYPKDRAFLKFLVAVLWVLDAISMAMLSYAIYTYLVLDFMDPLALEDFNWGMTTEPIVSNVIACTVHLFLIHRIWMLNKKLAPLAVTLVVTSLVTFAFGLVAVYHVVGFKNSNDNYIPKTWGPTTTLSLTSALDVVITFTICFEFYKIKTGFKRSDKIISILTAYTISSGMMPALVDIGALVSELVAPQTLIVEAFNAIISKAYINGLLAALNSRHSVVSQTGGFEDRLPENQIATSLQFGGAGITTSDITTETESTDLQLVSAKPEDSILGTGIQHYSSAQVV